MILTSTNNRSEQTTFAGAVERGLAPDGGLYMPVSLPVMPPDMLRDLANHDSAHIARETAAFLVGDEFPREDLDRIVSDACNFPAPLVRLDDRTSVLELFHGPTLSFKDFGARFMARILAYLHRSDSREIHVLVATSGDTGSAVAAGCDGVPGIKVILLYPAGRISPVQEMQLTTAGGNVTAVRVEGTFDDCQLFVKQAFADPDITQSRTLTSANSINIARLLAQTFYYMSAGLATGAADDEITFAVPSGNFGNLTAGLFARAMGLHIHRFIAATNANDVVPAYLKTGTFVPQPTKRTISNAMDVGNPSNLARIRSLFSGDIDAVRRVITADSCSDADTVAGIQRALHDHGYLFDPHGAVGYQVAARYRAATGDRRQIIVLGTAHPAKFPEVYPPGLHVHVTVPPQLSRLADLPQRFTPARAQFEDIKSIILQS